MRRGSGKYQQMKLPENKSLRERARQLRKESTLAEVLLWNQLKKKRANGLDFDRQKVIGNYIVSNTAPIRIFTSRSSICKTVKPKSSKYL